MNFLEFFSPPLFSSLSLIAKLSCSLSHIAHTFVFISASLVGAQIFFCVHVLSVCMSPETDLYIEKKKVLILE